MYKDVLLNQLALEFEKKYSEQPLQDGYATSLLVASNSYKNLPLKELVENWNISGLVQYRFANPSHFEIFNSMYVEENLEIIKTLCILKLISSFANCLDKEFEQIQIDFNNQIYGFSLNERKETAAINFLKNRLLW